MLTSPVLTSSSVFHTYEYMSETKRMADQSLYELMFSEKLSLELVHMLTRIRLKFLDYSLSEMITILETNLLT